MNYEDFEVNIMNNLDKPGMSEFLIRFLGFDYEDEGLEVDQCLYDAYSEKSKDELLGFEKELIAIINE